MYKYLLNNLLGRFDVDISKTKTSFVSEESIDELLSSDEVVSVTKITDKVSMVTYYPEISKRMSDSNGVDQID